MTHTHTHTHVTLQHIATHCNTWSSHVNESRMKDSRHTHTHTHDTPTHTHAHTDVVQKPAA